MMKALFFSPYADVWVHSLPEAEIADALRDSGWEIFRITCERDLSEHCVSMAAKGIDAAADYKVKSAVCSSCIHRRNLLQKSFKFIDQTIGSLITHEHRAEIEAHLSRVTPSNWTDFEIDAAPLGRMAFYDFSLVNKINTTTIPDQLWASYLSDLNNSVKTYFAVKTLMNEKKFDVLLTYNGMYATNNVAGYVARQYGCSTWSLHSGHHLVDRYGTMYLYESTTLPVLVYQSPEWNEDRSLPVLSDAATKVTEHILELFQATNRFVYSSPLEDLDLDEVRRSLGISSGRKVLLATMSSADEIFGAKMAGVLKDSKDVPLFENGFEWIRYLVEQIRDRPDLHLIIRVHPREFPNKRESKLSDNAVNLKKLLVNLPNNVSVNWPEQNISLYGLAHIVDVVLNASSSAGIEMSALGLPVVLHRVEHMLAYDPQMHPCVEDRNLYMAAVDDALSRGWSVENIRSAYRWWAFIFFRVAVDISEGFVYPSAGYISTSNDAKAKFKNGILRMAVKYGPSLQERLHLIRRKKLRNGPQFSATLTGNSRVLVTPRNLSTTEKLDETQILAREAKKLLQVLQTRSTENSNLVQNLRDFISRA